MFKFKTLDRMGVGNTWSVILEFTWGNQLFLMKFSLSSKRTQPTVKGVQTLQPFLLARELCRTWWPVSTYLPPTPSTFKETTTWTWNRTGCAKGPEDISLNCGWPDGKLAWPEMLRVFALGFRALSRKFNGPDRDQMSQEAIQTFSWDWNWICVLKPF